MVNKLPNKTQLHTSHQKEILKLFEDQALRKNIQKEFLVEKTNVEDLEERDMIFDDPKNPPQIINQEEKDFIFSDEPQDELEEAALTKGADVNEILLGFYLAGGSFKSGIYQDSKEVKNQLDKRKKEIDSEEYKDQKLRAKIMSQKTLEWASKNGFDGDVVEVWWTARPNVLSKAVGKPVDSRKNPSDVLIKIKGDKFLGISAKSTRGSGDIGFKNPGLGSLEKTIQQSISDSASKIMDKTVKKYKLPNSKSERKNYLRSNPELRAMTIDIGKKILRLLRDTLLEYLNSLDQEDRRNHITGIWMDASSDIYPYYIKVTGHGQKKNYTADVLDPLKNEKIKAVSSDPIDFEPVGNDSIGVTANQKRIMKMRFKFESEKLASSIKLSGDPWK